MSYNLIPDSLRFLDAVHGLAQTAVQQGTPLNVHALADRLCQEHPKLGLSRDAVADTLKATGQAYGAALSSEPAPAKAAA
jgi:hypothetical protein